MDYFFTFSGGIEYRFDFYISEYRFATLLTIRAFNAICIFPLFKFSLLTRKQQHGFSVQHNANTADCRRNFTWTCAESAAERHFMFSFL